MFFFKLKNIGRVTLYVPCRGEEKDLLLLQSSMALLVLCRQNWKWGPILSTSFPLGIVIWFENMSIDHTAFEQPSHIQLQLSAFLPETVNATLPGEHLDHNSFLPAFQRSVMM